MRRALRTFLSGAVLLTTFGLSEHAALADTPACTSPKTTCGGNAGYYASSEDLNRLTAVADPVLRDVRACLDGSGGKHVPAVLAIRWNSEGMPVDVKIDVPGYESLPCVQKAQTKLSALQNPHETAIRCEFGCPKPVAPTPAPLPPPVVAPTPAPAPTTTTAPAPTLAPAPPAVPPPLKHTEKIWYGYQTLIADAISIPVFLAGWRSETGEATAAGYLGFALAPPIIHMAHGNVGLGFGSMGIRLLGPPTTALIGFLAALIVTSGSVSDAGNRGSTGALVGTGVGVVGCVALDAFAFAYEKHVVDGPPPSNAAAPARPSFSIAPSLALHKNSGSVGLVGTF